MLRTPANLVLAMVWNSPNGRELLRFPSIGLFVSGCFSGRSSPGGLPGCLGSQADQTMLGVPAWILFRIRNDPYSQMTATAARLNASQPKLKPPGCEPGGAACLLFDAGN
jgi:hypothetical protein